MQEGNVTARTVSIEQEIPIEKYVIDRSKEVHSTDFDESRQQSEQPFSSFQDMVESARKSQTEDSEVLIQKSVE